MKLYIYAFMCHIFSNYLTPPNVILSPDDWRLSKYSRVRSSCRKRGIKFQFLTVETLYCQCLSMIHLCDAVVITVFNRRFEIILKTYQFDT